MSIFGIFGKFLAGFFLIFFHHFPISTGIFSNAIPLIKINFFGVNLFSLAFLCIDPVESEVIW